MKARRTGRAVAVAFPFGTVRGPVIEINERLKSATIRDESGKEHLFMGDEGATNVQVWLAPLPA